MGLFNKQRTDGITYDGQGIERKGLIDVIKYNGEADELVWKFPYDNLTTGAQLIVNESQEAVFFKGGAVADVFGLAHTHCRPTTYRFCKNWSICRLATARHSLPKCGM